MLLALDTSADAVAVAVADPSSGRVLAEQTGGGGLRHAEQLTPTVAAVLDEAGLGVADLTAIAVGVGPGPFTGLRVGLVTARTLASARRLGVTGVCSLDVLAAQAYDTGAGGFDGPFVVATDARRKEVYWASYDSSDGQLRRHEGPHVDLPAVLAEHLDGRPVSGPGADLYADLLDGSRGPARLSAGAMATGVLAGRFAELPPEPLYLRRPDVTVSAKHAQAYGPAGR